MNVIYYLLYIVRRLSLSFSLSGHSRLRTTVSIRQLCRGGQEERKRNQVFAEMIGLYVHK